MLSVFLIWIYIFLTTMIISYPLLQKTSFRAEDRTMFGLMIATVFSEYFSLFGKVGLVANIVLVSACLIIVIIFRKKMIGDLRRISSEFKGTKKRILFIVFAVLFIAFMTYGTSRGYFHVDSDLYHGQAIRWIEEYGLVKGLANLHMRLAYNSASFAATALYSFSFLGGQSFHVVAGYIVTVMLVMSLRIFFSLRTKRVGVADFARLGVIYYCFNIYDEMVSPASDYFAMLYFLYIIVRVIEVSETEAHESKTDEYALLAMTAVFTVTIKMSTLPVILVAAVPVYLLIREKKIRKIIIYFVSGFGIALPYFIREYFLSGRLLYPSTAFDIFSPVWKVPSWLAKMDSDYIIAFARGYSSTDAAEYPFSVWIINWLSKLSMTEKIMFMASICVILLLPVSMILRKKIRGFHIAEITCIASFIFWFFSAPLVRYGQGYLLILPVVMVGDVVLGIADKAGEGKEKTKRKYRPVNIVFAAVAVLFICYKLGISVLGIRENYAQGLYIKQLDYGKYELIENDIDGVTVYSSPNGGGTGYDPFPATPFIEPGLSLIGEDIKSGFYYK